MSAQTTSWILELVDHISSPMKNVVNNSTHAAKGVEKVGTELNSLQGKMSGISNMPGKILGALGIGFGMFQFVAMMDKGIEKAHELHAAEAQLQNTMQNMGYSNADYEKAVKNSKDLASGMKYSSINVMELQSQLRLVGNIGESEMTRMTMASANMAAKFGMGLTEAGNSIAKAVNNPEMLRRLGMQLKIDPAIQKHLQDLAKGGHEAQARLELLNIVEQKVGGAAKAAFDADPLARYNKTVGAIQVQMGEAVIGIQKIIAPGLEKVADFMKDIFTKVANNMEPVMNAITPIWDTISMVFKEAWTYISAFLGQVGGVIEFLTGTKSTGDGVVDTMRTIGSVLEYLSYPIKALGDMLVFVIDKFGFLAIGYGIITAAQWLWNIAMDANPLGLIIGGVAVLVGTIMYAWDKFGVFRGGIMATWETIKGFGNILKEYVIDRVMGIINGFGSIAKAIGQLFNKDYKGAWATAKQAGSDLFGITADENALKNAGEVGKRIGSAYQKGVSEVAANDKKKADDTAVAKKKDTDLGKGFSPAIKPTDLDGGGSGKGGLSGSGGGVGGVKTITQKIDIKNYFTVTGGNVEEIAERVVRVINDRLRDATVALQ